MAFQVEHLLLEELIVLGPLPIHNGHVPGNQRRGPAQVAGGELGGGVDDGPVRGGAGGCVPVGADRGDGRLEVLHLVVCLDDLGAGLRRGDLPAAGLQPFDLLEHLAGLGLPLGLSLGLGQSRRGLLPGHAIERALLGPQTPQLLVHRTRLVPETHQVSLAVLLLQLRYLLPQRLYPVPEARPHAMNTPELTLQLGNPRVPPLLLRAVGHRLLGARGQRYLSLCLLDLSFEHDDGLFDHSVGGLKLRGDHTVSHQVKAYSLWLSVLSELGFAESPSLGLSEPLGE